MKSKSKINLIGLAALGVGFLVLLYLAFLLFEESKLYGLF